MGNETRNREKFMASIGRKKPKDLKKKRRKKKGEKKRKKKQRWP